MFEKKYKLTRSVRIRQIEETGISLTVEFRGIHWHGMPAFETESAGRSWGGSEPTIEITSRAFPSFSEAKVWLVQLTEEVKKKAREVLPLAEEFRALEGEVDLGEIRVPR